jgi:hypothetical protein
VRRRYHRMRDGLRLHDAADRPVHGRDGPSGVDIHVHTGVPNVSGKCARPSLTATAQAGPTRR